MVPYKRKARIRITTITIATIGITTVTIRTEDVYVLTTDYVHRVWTAIHLASLVCGAYHTI